MSEGGGFVAEGSAASSPSGGLARAEANRQAALERLERRRAAAPAGPSGGPQIPNDAASQASRSNGPQESGSVAPKDGASASSGSVFREGPSASTTSTSQPRRGQKRDYMNYYEFNLSELRDTKGGFMAVEADPNEGEQQGREGRGKPIEKRLRQDPQIILPLEDNPMCRHCKSLTIDANLHEHFKVDVCRTCRDANPEKYSLLTKTECREDYLLTESELKDAELLPCWLRPNPHKTTWSNMMLYLREQVEAFAWTKWGSAEKLDEEFERRNAEKKQKKEKKHKEKMAELRRKTQTSAWHKKEVKHEHRFVIEEEDGVGTKIEMCKECGLTLEVEEM